MLRPCANTTTVSASEQQASQINASIDLYWLPLGAGGRSVRWNGRIFETLVARHEHRPALDLYHSALEVGVGSDRYVIEMGPEWSGSPVDRGAVCGGPVGLRWLGHSRLFRYEVRCARGGAIPDIAEAFGGPQRVSQDIHQARRILELVPRFPTSTWGRDELRTGEMLNSNSLTAWLLASSGHDMHAIGCPPHGRAPGWSSGLVLAARDERSVTASSAPMAARTEASLRSGEYVHPRARYSGSSSRAPAIPM